MNVTAVIAECNPLHRGHEYLLQSARRRTGADFVVLALSGNYVQRGEPAVIGKYERARALLRCGADLVLELPLYYACGGADYFARGAVALLSSLGVVTDLCFGSESGDTAAVMRAGKALAAETPERQKALRAYLRQGLPYPAARERAWAENLFSTPNDLLAAEYCKALTLCGSAIRPHAVKRIAAASASALRAAALDIRTQAASANVQTDGQAADDADKRRDAAAQAAADITRQAGSQTYDDAAALLRSSLPAPMRGALAESCGRCAPLSADDFSLPLLYRLRMGAAPLTDCLDVSPDLQDRIQNLLPQFLSWTQFCALLKTKNLTYTRLSRALLHLLLDVRRDYMEEYLAAGTVGYARVLGFRRSAAPLLQSIGQNAAVPLLTKLAGAERRLAPPFDRMLAEEVRAAEFYDTVARQRFAAGAPALPPLPRECQRPIVII